MNALIPIFIFSVLVLTGCSNIQDTIYLQDIEVSTPLNVPPINLTTDASEGKVTISPKFYFNEIGYIEGNLEHSPVNSFSQFEVDTIDNRLVPSSNNKYNYSGKNLTWNIPDVLVGVDLDVPLGKVVSIIAGFNVSSKENTELWGGNLGVSLRALSDYSAIRFSGGINWQQNKYFAETVVIRQYTPLFGEQETSVYFFNDTDKETEMNLYLSLSYNSNFPDFPVDFYLGTSYFRQTLFDFAPTNPDVIITPFYTYTEIDARGEYSAGFFNLSPGIFTDISYFGRVVGGINFIFGTSGNNEMETSFIVPFVKFEFFL